MTARNNKKYKCLGCGKTLAMCNGAFVFLCQTTVCVLRGYNDQQKSNNWEEAYAVHLSRFNKYQAAVEARALEEEQLKEEASLPSSIQRLVTRTDARANKQINDLRATVAALTDEVRLLTKEVESLRSDVLWANARSSEIERDVAEAKRRLGPDWTTTCDRCGGSVLKSCLRTDGNNAFPNKQRSVCPSCFGKINREWKESYRNWRSSLSRRDELEAGFD